MPRSRVVSALLRCLPILLASACGDPRANEARLLVARYDAIMAADDAERPARIDRLRELSVLDDEVRRVRDRCLLTFDAMARGVDASRRIEELTLELDRLADAGSPVPGELHREAAALVAATEAAMDTADRHKLECLDGVSRLRAHHVRR